MEYWTTWMNDGKPAFIEGGDDIGAGRDYFARKSRSGGSINLHTPKGVQTLDAETAGILGRELLRVSEEMKHPDEIVGVIHVERSPRVGRYVIEVQVTGETWTSPGATTSEAKGLECDQVKGLPKL